MFVNGQDQLPFSFLLGEMTSGVWDTSGSALDLFLVFCSGDQACIVPGI